MSQVVESGQHVMGQTVGPYHNNLSNMQCETLGEFIAQESGVMIKTPRCEFSERINYSCKYGLYSHREHRSGCQV